MSGAFRLLLFSLLPFQNFLSLHKTLHKNRPTMPTNPTVADYRTSNRLILRVPAVERPTVTAEVASSSLVVPAIPNQALTPVEEFSRGHKKVQVPREASNSAHSSPIIMFRFNPGLEG
jgi:hypothetical protein